MKWEERFHSSPAGTPPEHHSINPFLKGGVFVRFISIFFSSIFYILLILQINFVYSQFEDDEFEIESGKKCLPESLTTKYEAFANLKVEKIEIRRWYSFGSEYYKQKNYTEAVPYFWKVFLNDTTKLY